MKKNRPKKPAINFSHSLGLASFFILGLVTLFIIILVSYQVAYRHKIYPGIKVAGINIGNKTVGEATELLKAKLLRLQENGVSLSFNGEVKTYTLEQLGVNYDLETAVREAYQIGRQPNLFTSLGQKVASWNGFYNLSPQFSFNGKSFTNSLDYFNNKVKKAPQEAKVTYQKGTLNIIPPQKGESLDFYEAKNNFLTLLQTMSTSPILLTQKTIQPQMTENEVSAFREKITSLLSSPLKLTFNDKVWEINQEELANLISFSKKQSHRTLQVKVGAEVFGINEVKIDRPQTSDTGQIILDQDKLTTELEAIADEIDQEAVDAKFNFENGRVLQFASHRDGQKLDQPASLDAINQAFNERQSGTGPQEVPLKVVVTKAQVTTESVNNLGIKELIGVGVSKFAGSIPNRAANVGLAASRVNGALIPPGETFSMYKTIGEVDASTGYKEAYIISKGRTQLDFGGGVCQVSTTLFRAALNAGLPIVERHQHAYRVGYYEQNSPPGIDAAVFFPYSDFRFRNDTGHHVLVQTKFNASAATLTFEFYGTKDGREVVMTKPTVSNITPAPPELHQDDPTLPAGTVKQVDFPASGATTSFNWKVTRGGETIHQQTFFSKYAPWQAIFLHGTKVG